ncbi:MAG: dihydroorotate dehydrogenase electron transfer subunit [Synergistaceae bacterium]|jgi:dihydroorotate dehydrogenase electron transfer subunit|nr:dihydroorotate dehydrogenase electron transfer subunit [Synergistaceae bacterium]
MAGDKIRDYRAVAVSVARMAADAAEITLSLGSAGQEREDRGFRRNEDVQERIKTLPSGFDPDPAPGQFAHISVPGSFLRRPFSIAGYDRERKLARFIVRRAGAGSAALSSLSAGSEVSVLFPLGTPLPMELAASLSEAGGKVWLVAGGAGVAPMLFAAQRAAEEGVRLDSFVGFRDEELVFGVDEMRACGEVSLSVGELLTGRLLEALESRTPDLILACGPEGMLRALQGICLERGLRAYASLEERMGCGIGACLVCNCRVRSRDGFTYKRVCADGPVFDLSEAVFK